MKKSYNPAFKRPNPPLSTPTSTVPILRFGDGNSSALLAWKKKIILAAMEKYGDLARCLETLQYYEIPEVEVDDYDPTADPHGFTLGDLKEAIKIRQQKEDKMLQQRPNLYSFLLSSISDESVDAIKQLEDFSEFHLEKDPLSLWNAILSVHRLQEHSYDENMVKFDSRRQLRTCTQDRHESLVRFFERFSETCNIIMIRGIQKWKTLILHLIS
jgi:hypothetical protein